MTRVTAGAIPDLRAARRASVPLSKIFFRFPSFRPQAGFYRILEIERNLQIDAPIGSRRRKRPAGKPIGFAKDG